MLIRANTYDYGMPNLPIDGTLPDKIGVLVKLEWSDGAITYIRPEMLGMRLNEGE